MTCSGLAARCPAKVNLELRVLGRRPDGYHELDTVFQAVDLWDELRVEPAGKLTLTCDHPGLSTDDDNLVLRAARSLARRTGREAYGALQLLKSIPVRAGLGGGSSNAAAALLLLDRFWSTNLDRSELSRLGAELGADVPFFLTGGTARGQGRGDRIEPLAFVGELPLLLGFPPHGTSTAEVFRRHASRLTPPGNGVSVPLLSGLKWPGENDFGVLANDLEAVVFEDWPELKRFRDALLEVGSRAALLSGSGSTVFGVFPGCESLRTAAGRLETRFPGWRILGTRAVEGAAEICSEGYHTSSDQ